MSYERKIQTLDTLSEILHLSAEEKEKMNWHKKSKLMNEELNSTKKKEKEESRI